jgi:hypothetical protein
MKIGSSETTREAPNTLHTTKTVVVKEFTFTSYILPEHKKNIDFSFLEWFIGFSEGNACFYSRIENTRVRLFFEITQKDPALMYKVRTTLGFGQVTSFRRNNETYWKFSVEDKRGVQRIMLLFNGNLVLPKRYEEFVQWVNFGKNLYPANFILKVQRVEVSLRTGWLAGFIESEGCFYANLKFKDTLCLKDWDFDQKLTITQQDTHGESRILQHIIILCDSVDVKLHLAKKPNCYRIELCSLKAHTIVVSYLMQFPLLGKKKIAFLRWWRIYLRRQEPKEKQISTKTIQKLKKLCSKINAFQK